MAVIVVGGHSHGIGKTSVASGLISAFADLGWTAMKITPCGPGVCPVKGPGCTCKPVEHPYSMLPEESRRADTDTSRFLAAGAIRAYWVRVKAQGLAVAAPEILSIVQESAFTMIESNSILRYLQPDLYIMVVRLDVEDWKDSAREFLKKADIAVVVETGSALPAVSGIESRTESRLSWIHATPPNLVTDDLLKRVRLLLNLPRG